jgi:hypothetical protein
MSADIAINILLAEDIAMQYIDGRRYCNKYMGKLLKWYQFRNKLQKWYQNGRVGKNPLSCLSRNGFWVLILKNPGFFGFRIY